MNNAGSSNKHPMSPESLPNTDHSKCLENMSSYKVLFRHYIPRNTMQITKMTKAVNYYRGNLGRKHKKKVKKSRKEGIKISQGAKFRNPCKIVIFSALFAFWFYSSMFQLISSCSSCIPIFNIYSLRKLQKTAIKLIRSIGRS